MHAGSSFEEAANALGVTAVRAILFALVTTLVVAPARAGGQGDHAGESYPAARSLGRHLAHSPRLLGDPGGVRSRLESLGISFQLFYNQYLAWKPTGGLDPDSTAGHSGSYDFFGHVDFEESTGWPGLDLLLHVKGQYDRNVNADVGALSDPIDDADFDAPIYISELWLRQAFLRDRARLLAGFLEQQTVFDRNAYANSEDRQFMTAFLDNNPVIPLPNGLGAVLLVNPVRWLELVTGVADGENIPRRAGTDTSFDGFGSLTGYLEIDLKAAVPRGGRLLPGSYRLGAFVDGREKTVFGRTDPATGLPESERGTLGAYLSFDQLVFLEEGEDGQGLGLFARAGYADPEVNRIAWFWSLGLQYAGLLPGRDADVLGLGGYQAIGSERYRETVDADFDRESGIELYYRVALLPWLAVTPDVQYVVDPGATGAPNAVVVAMRFRVIF